MAPLIPSRPHNPIHLYRHLLREASYLPPACQPYFTGRIQSRFRKHRHDADHRGQQRLRQANHDLRFLRAANAGDMVRMNKVLLLSFGRRGARRRELMVQLRMPEPPANSAELNSQISEAAAAGTGTAASPHDWLDKWDTDKLLVAAKSQGHQNLNTTWRPSIKPRLLRPSDAVPPTSIWGQPFHEKVARTKQKKWWILLAHRMLPPVAKGEWDLLRDLADGIKGSEWNMPPRRPVGVPVAAAGAEAGDGTPPQSVPWDWVPYLKAPVSSVERPRARLQRLLNGIQLDDGAATGAHAYTPRWWRRRYREIWQHTPTMAKREPPPPPPAPPGKPAKAWEIQWGKPRMQPMQAGPAHREFFAGVDGDNGKLPIYTCAALPRPRQVKEKRNTTTDTGAKPSPRNRTEATTPRP